MNNNTIIYKATWPSGDNVVISLYNDFPCQIGIIEIRIYKTGEHKGEAYLWNLHVVKNSRGKGYGRLLLDEATAFAMSQGCKAVSLDWDIEEAPKWVFDWYVRNGFDEREFGRGCAYMVKELK